jgi:hypothetical protein
MEANVDEDASPQGGYLLTVNPAQVAARQHLGGPGEPALTLTFTPPSDLVGGGVPTDLRGATDLAIAEIELPQAVGSTDENARGSLGLLSFDGPHFCVVGSACTPANMDGYWSATIRAQDGSSREVQLAHSQSDQTPFQGVSYYRQVLGAFLPRGEAIRQGERLILIYQGKMTGRATDWSDLPFIMHFRYRSFDAYPLAVHGVELVFLFDNFGTVVPTAADLALSDAMAGYWTRFAATGNPNGSGAPEWPRYDAVSDNYLRVDEPPLSRAGIQSAQCDFWDRLGLGNG